MFPEVEFNTIIVVNKLKKNICIAAFGTQLVV